MDVRQDRMAQISVARSRTWQCSHWRWSQSPVEGRSDVLHVWWVGPKGTLEGAYIVIDKTQWTRYQVAGQGSASLSAGISSLHRYSGTEEIYWIAPNGAMFNAYWYENMP